MGGRTEPIGFTVTFDYRKKQYNRLIGIGWHPMNRHGRSKSKCAECGMHPLHAIHGSPGGWRYWANHEFFALRQILYGHDWQLKFRESEVPELQARVQAAIDEGRKLRCRTR